MRAVLKKMLFTEQVRVILKKVSFTEQHKIGST